MSMGPLGGVVGSSAGSPLSQTQGAAAERAKQDAAAQERTVETDRKSEQASGIGQTEEDQGASERDADGRRMWERSGGKKPEAEDHEEGAKPNVDGTGEHLDLIG